MDEEKEKNQKNNSEPSQQLPRFYGQIPGSASVTGGRKREWPELVGMKAEEAEKKIKEEMAGVQIQVVPPDSFVTMDYRLERVRLYLDSSGNVIRAPMIG